MLDTISAENLTAARGRPLRKNRWPDERVERLRNLHADGVSYKLIAVQLGVTKNAVCGQLARMGLSAKKGPRLRLTHTERHRRIAEQEAEKNRRAKLRRATAKLFATPRLKPEPRPEPAPVEDIIPIGQRCTLLDLNGENCHWPNGDPGTPGFYFCGGPAAVGLPYCGHHARIAYQAPSEARRDRKRSVYIPPRSGRRST